MQIAKRKAFAALFAGFGLLTIVGRASAVTTEYFDTNGATAGFGTLTGTYDWDDTTNGGLWSTSSTGVLATTPWPQGNFPRFAPATPAQTYAVTVSNIEQITGLFAATAQTLTINAVGGGGLQAIDTGTGADGFLGVTGSTVTINAPISGAGQVNPSNGGNIYFNGVNTYTGGTLLSTSASLIHFNNASAFGPGTITVSATNASSSSYAPLLASGGTTITLANNFTTSVAAGITTAVGVNFAADANTPVVSTGTWTLGAVNLNLRSNTPTSPVSLTGVISGTAGVTLSGNTATGLITFSGANTYTGTTTVGVSGSANVRLRLGLANTIATSPSVVLAGGTLDPDGISQAMTATTLGLTAASTIDYSVGAAEVDFANSSAVAWTGASLNLANFNPLIDKLRIGTDGTGLTSAQVAKITINGGTTGNARLDAQGFVVPEPTTLGAIAATAAAFARRRRRA